MPRPTINDVAARAGVSKKTVSFVLNRRDGIAASTRGRVESAIAELGFTPSAQARGLSRGEDASIVLAWTAGDRSIVGDAVCGALRALEGTGLALIVIEGEQGLAAILRDRTPHGLVILGSFGANANAVAVTPCDHGLGVRTLARQAASDAARYLLTLGHNRVALAAGPEGDPLSLAHEQGLADALGEAPLLVANGDGSVAAGREAAEALLDLSPSPTAILATHAEMALGVVYAAQKRGIAVPAGLSVIALSDGAVAEQAYPPITAMRHDWAYIAEQAAKLALATDDRSAVDCPARLVVRGSTMAV